MARKLYIEALIRADLDDLWQYTQDPSFHQRWDGRFNQITYLPRDEGEPQRFRYMTLGVAGVGISAGERWNGSGQATSVLRFASDHPLSPIRKGSGYWRYVPTTQGIRFITGYDYKPGWGRIPDVIVRRLMGWLTAWSFDRLRIWLEFGVPPEIALARALSELLVRFALVAVAMSHSWSLAVIVAVIAILVPCLPKTPSARRCRRIAPKRAKAPASLETLREP